MFAIPLSVGYAIYYMWFKDSMTPKAIEKRKAKLRAKLTEINGEMDTVELERMVNAEEAKLTKKRSKLNPAQSI